MVLPKSSPPVNQSKSTLSENIEILQESKSFDDNFIKIIFARLTSIYGERFSNRLSPPEALQAAIYDWREGLVGLHRSQVDRAIKACRRPYSAYSKWPPTLGEFVELCWPTPEELNFPAAIRALEMINLLITYEGCYINNYSYRGREIPEPPDCHFLAEQTYREMASQWRNIPSDKILDKFSKNYEKNINKYLIKQANFEVQNEFTRKLAES